MKSKVLALVALILAFGAPVFAQHSVALHWNAVTVAANGTAIPSADLKYDVYKTPCLVPFAKVSGSAVNATCMFAMPPQPIALSSSANYQDNSVAPGTSYEYFVTAVCEDQSSVICLFPSESDPSNTVVATIAPAAPAGAKAVAH